MRTLYCLLVCVVAAIDSCDRQNVEYDVTKVRLLPPSNRYLYLHAICAHPDEQLYVAGKFYGEKESALECEESIGWRCGGQGLEYGPNDRIKIECRMKKCDMFFINGNHDDLWFGFMPTEVGDVDGEEEKWRSSRKFLTCKNSKHSMRFNGKYQPESAVCNLATNKWEFIGASGDEMVNVQCAATCQFDDQNINVTVTELGDGRTKITCNPGTLTFNGTDYPVPRIFSHTRGWRDTTRYSWLTCDPSNGWKGSFHKSPSVGAHEVLSNLECNEYCKYVYRGDEELIVQIVDDCLIIRPKDDSYGIEVSRRPLMASMTCSWDQLGWHNYLDDLRDIYDGTNYFTVRKPQDHEEGRINRTKGLPAVCRPVPEA